MYNTSQLWIQTGIVTATQNKRRYIPVHEIAKGLGGVPFNKLPEAHVLTGCDRASAIYGIGIKTLMKVITKTPENFSELVKLSGTDGDAALEQARKLVSSLYDQPGTEYNYHHDLNNVRTRIAKQKDLSLSKIPPCEASFLQHVKRVAWQARVWKAAHVVFHDLGTPLDFG